MHTTTISDQPQREQALDPQGSFIVQAPAGAGKTELLVQRYLTLLAHAEKAPEEIIAITFTRKAAIEMRHRVLAALRMATEPMPEAPHAQRTWRLAAAALQQNMQQKWNLLENPQRLRILTIDAFSASLTRQMPMLSGFGAQPQILEDARDLYLEAARRLMAHLEEANEESLALTQLLVHLDNRVESVEALFVRMLARRDQWLPHLLAHQHYQSAAEFRSTLEANLKNIVQEALNECYQQLPPTLQKPLIELLNYASAELRRENVTHPICRWAETTNLEKPKTQDLALWQAIGNFLLTEKDTWRAAVDKRLGFPPTNKIMKENMQQFLAALFQHEKFRLSLQNLRVVPPINYSESQWQVVSALITLLPTLVAELSVLFQEYGATDFAEISIAALRALGETDAPTDLALFLDHQIRHILVDEFQDTSITQFRLLQQITAGWQPDDGRTLFLVGDPMQSIYRFRQAEVGLFLKAQQEGIGHLQLQPLRLETNFRSTPTVVSWINQYFQNLFPNNPDITSGAVPFNASISAQTENACSTIYAHGILKQEGMETSTSADKIVHIIKKAQQEDPDQSMAILVRSRTHLLQIIPALKNANLAFSAVEIEPLANQSIVQDLMALTRAMMHLGDRVAWLAILRAPWCGLTLADLHAIARKNSLQPLWSILQDYREIKELSVDGQKRLAQIVPVLQRNLAERGRHALRDWIEKTWRELKGPLCLQTTGEITAAEAYCKLLEELDEAGDVRDLEKITEKVIQKYSTPNASANTRLQVMTIHKAKGLEFDTVIIPHLEAKTRADDTQLLLWLDRARKDKANEFILAPIKASEEDHDPIYRYVNSIEKEKSQHEITRLLYVAVTRAKKNLYLLAEHSFKQKEIAPPNHACFLKLLWAAFEFQEAMPIQENILAPHPQTSLRRLSLACMQNTALDPLATKIERSKSSDSYVAVDETPRIIGTAIHKILQDISQCGWQLYDTNKLHALQNTWKNYLLRGGILPTQVSITLAHITHIITQTLQDSRAQWILNNTHSEAQSEFALSSIINGEIQHLVMDRTFVDQNNIRWIVDYKTSSHTGTIEEFLDSEQATHQTQLEKYAQALQQWDNRPIRLGLYFPAFCGWREWAFGG